MLYFWYIQPKGLNVSSETIPDKTLSKIIYQSYETTRRQDKLRNGARLRHQFFKDFNEDELRKRMQDTIDRHGFIVYKEEEFQKKVKQALVESDMCKKYEFASSVDKVSEDINQFTFKDAKVPFSPGLVHNISKYIDFYAYAKDEKCVFKIMHSRQSAANIKSLLYLFQSVNKGYTFYILSLEEKVPKAYTDLGAEVILVSELLDIDVDKLIIV